MTTNLRCAVCEAYVTAGTVCRPDADRGLGILGELASWAEELRLTASGIRGARASDRRATRVDPPGVVDEARLDLAERLDVARQQWYACAWADGCDDLLAAGGYFVPGWHLGGAFAAAMIAAERAALDTLDPDEAVLREAKARQARHAASSGVRAGTLRLAEALASPGLQGRHAV